MPKDTHELRDPIHVFIRMDSQERRVLNSPEFQRLRHVHQLAMTYLIYPGATHRRFEHCLGTMELATQIYDKITSPDRVSEAARARFAELGNSKTIGYYRSVVRMAALCHDIGHLPFSHAAEHELLPKPWNHERIGGQIIRSQSMRALWSESPPINTEDIVKVALGTKYDEQTEVTDWQRLMSEIVTGDVFGADRMDYLLRDSHHAGVAYGRFDHHRLIDCLRILPVHDEKEREEGGRVSAFALGVEEGGLQSAEALLLARYMMYSQVYFHHVRRIYDVHLREFLQDWLESRYGMAQFPTDPEAHRMLTDNEVLAAIHLAAAEPDAPGHASAKILDRREHFKLVYRLSTEDASVNPLAATEVYRAAAAEFGDANLRESKSATSPGSIEFPVEMDDGDVRSSLAVSQILEKIPAVSAHFVYANPGERDRVRLWIQQHRRSIIAVKGEG